VPHIRGSVVAEDSATKVEEPQKHFCRKQQEVSSPSPENCTMRTGTVWNRRGVTKGRKKNKKGALAKKKGRTPSSNTWRNRGLFESRNLRGREKKKKSRGTDFARPSPKKVGSGAQRIGKPSKRTTFDAQKRKAAHCDRKKDKPRRRARGRAAWRSKWGGQKPPYRTFPANVATARTHSIFKGNQQKKRLRRECDGKKKNATVTKKNDLVGIESTIENNLAMTVEGKNVNGRRLSNAKKRGKERGVLGLLSSGGRYRRNPRLNQG